MQEDKKAAADELLNSVVIKPLREAAKLDNKYCNFALDLIYNASEFILSINEVIPIIEMIKAINMGSSIAKAKECLKC